MKAPNAVPINKLILDPENPRLPEDLQGGSQEQLFAYLYRHGVLDELVDSMLDNGFFGHEPLVVLPENDDGKHVVVEGNRRLAALMLIHDREPTADYEPAREPTEDEQKRLAEIMCYEVASRDEVRAFLGFRHISGLRPWKPEAKARYVTSEVEKAEAEGEERPFLTVARQVGSNVQGIRNAFVALALLRHAHAECGAPIGFVLSERFGVWTRCLNSPEIREYFNYSHDRTLEGVRAAFDGVNCERLGEVIQDLTPEGDHRPAILSDSRLVTQYGLVLESDAAREVLRKYGDLQIAIQVVTRASFPDRVAEIRARVDALRGEIEKSVEYSSRDLVTETDKLARASSLLQAIVGSLREGKE